MKPIPLTPRVSLTTTVARHLRPRRSMLPMLVVLAASLQPVSTPVLAQDQPVVETRSGSVRGTAEANVVKFLGIPYAKPPVGDLRWTLPAAPEPWTGVRNATEYGKTCAQVKELGDFGKASTDEDCLYLNVFAPRGAQKRPVMMWIHGGATTGASNGHDGTALAGENNVIVVTINYRMGALGALIHPALDGGGATTHYGLRDEQFAMKWIQDNIERFGGDPGNVTIFGESTGGNDVAFHVTSPTAKGLFHRAIMQSPARYFNPLLTLAAAEEKGKAFATAVGCTDQSAECLRKVPVSALLTAQGSFGGGANIALPINDGHVLTMTMAESIRSGQFNRVPIFIMTTRDENRWFQAFAEVVSGKVTPPEDYPTRLTTSFAANAAAVQAAYPLASYGNSAGSALGAVFGDYGAICQPRSLAVDASKYVTAYFAEFADEKSPGILPPVSFPLLASHTHEIQYIFPGWKGVYEGKVQPFTAEQEKLAKDMRRIWATFAEKGSLPSNLPPVTREAQPVISLETPSIRVTNDFAKAHKCDLWDGIRKWTPVQ